MIDICLFGRDIGPRPRLRDEPAFYPTFISHAGIIIRPIVVVVVERSSRDLRCDDYIVRCERYKKFGKESVSRTIAIVGLFCPTNGHDDQVEGPRRRSIGCTSSTNFSLGIKIFPRFASSNWQRTRRDS